MKFINLLLAFSSKFSCRNIFTCATPHSKIMEDRFQPVLDAENLCFLCLESAQNLCEKCGVPYCSEKHFRIHYDSTKDYCFPFRVLQKPEVSKNSEKECLMIISFFATG